ncbi:MAG: hypothetical protein PHD76_10430 [Methylacidiphilales bacterium]|nr:hypothetical protein [Candidatus Methylacidiphilales bacterium]
MKKQIIILITVLTFVSSAYAQTSSLPKILTDGIETYKKDGYSKAFDVWLTGSPLEKDTTTKVNITGGIAQIEAGLGKFLGYEYLGTAPFTPSVKRYYLVFLYEKGPLYTWFEIYSREGKDIIPSFDCNTKANLILPASFIEKK